MTTTAMTVQDFAEATGLALKQLLDQLRQQFPGKSWSGYRDIQVRPCVIQKDKRAPKERLAILQYWKDLMHSALEGMVQTGYVTLPEWESAEV